MSCALQARNLAGAVLNSLRDMAMSGMWHLCQNAGRRDFVDKNRIAGAAKQVKGSVKAATGKVLGDAKLQAEGKAEKAEGKIQNAIGGLKDKAKH